jgi:hypothetical protein
MDRSVHAANIALLRTLIAESELDPARNEDRHRMLMTLLAEENGEGQQAAGCPVSVLTVAPHNSRRALMKHLIIPLLLIGGFAALTTTEANAIVCARGVYRAGCVGAGGAAVVARRPVARRAVVVAPRAVVRRRVY